MIKEIKIFSFPTSYRLFSLTEIAENKVLCFWKKAQIINSTQVFIH